MVRLGVECRFEHLPIRRDSLTQRLELKGKGTPRKISRELLETLNRLMDLPEFKTIRDLEQGGETKPRRLARGAQGSMTVIGDGKTTAVVMERIGTIKPNEENVAICISPKGVLILPNGIGGVLRIRVAMRYYYKKRRRIIVKSKKYSRP